MTTTDELTVGISPEEGQRPRRNRGLGNPAHITANVSKDLYARLDTFARCTGTDIGLAAALRIIMDTGLKAKGF